jgi:hypothetical protein
MTITNSIYHFVRNDRSCIDSVPSSSINTMCHGFLFFSSPPLRPSFPTYRLHRFVDALLPSGNISKYYYETKREANDTRQRNNETTMMKKKTIHIKQTQTQIVHFIFLLCRCAIIFLLLIPIYVEYKFMRFRNSKERKKISVPTSSSRNKKKTEN